MNEEQRYLFDLQGYLVIQGALSPDEVTSVNELIDSRPSWSDASGSLYVHTGFDEATLLAEGNQDPEHGPIDFYSGLLLDWGEPIRRLVDHPALVPHLRMLLGPEFRLDHAYAIFQRQGHISTGHELHGGGTPHDPTQFYAFHGNAMFNGLVVCSIALSDVPEGAGGFCCIPGSHKGNYSLPAEYRDLSHPADVVVQVPLKAGDAVVFTEALSHGASAWSGGHDRRALLFKYCPGYMKWEKGSPFVDVAAHEWSDRQRRILREPFAGDRSGVDGEAADDFGARRPMEDR